jgi:hypothetical protein
VVTIAQLLAAGLDHEAVRRRVADGKLHRLYRGVYALGHDGLSREGRWLAAVFACGPTAALSHLSAAELWAVSRFHSSLIAVVTTSQHRPQGVDVHRTTRFHPLDITTINNIPVTRIPRLIVDLTDVLTPHQLANVIHRAAYAGLYSELATRDAIARANGRRNIGTAIRAMELYAAGSAGTRSASEDIALSLLPLAGAPGPLVNTKLQGEEVDFHWPEQRLVVELDGPGHNRPPTRLDDQRRDAKLGAAGYTVKRIKSA